MWPISNEPNTLCPDVRRASDITKPGYQDPIYQAGFQDGERWKEGSPFNPTSIPPITPGCEGPSQAITLNRNLYGLLLVELEQEQKLDRVANQLFSASDPWLLSYIASTATTTSMDSCRK